MALEAVGRSRGVVVAWNEFLFAKVNQRVRRSVVAVKLAQLDNRWQWVVVSTYGPTSPSLREELWADN